MTTRLDPTLAADAATRITNLFAAAVSKPANPGSTPKPPVMPPDPGLPTDLLPGPIESWLHDTAILAGVPPVMITMPYLAGTGAVIGNRLGLELQPGWTEYPVLWIALITLTGGGKTPALLAARQPFNALHKDLLATTPNAPLIIDRGSWAQLQHLLPHVNGLLLHRDELLGLIRAIDRGTGEDRQRYLSLWSGDAIDQATHQIIEHPVVAIVGGIQPLLLATFRRKQHDGLLERFLPILAGGPSLPWRTDPPAVPDLQAVLTPLRVLRARPGQTLVTNSPEAQHLWASWYDAQIALTAGNHLVLHGFYRKYPNHLARLILVLHALWHPEHPDTPVSRNTVDRAITLIEYVRIQLHRSLVLVNQKHALRSPTASLIVRIERYLAANKQNHGWTKRSALSRQLGCPPSALMSTALDQLATDGRLERRTVKGDRGPSAEELRLAIHSSIRTNSAQHDQSTPKNPMESTTSASVQISYLANQMLADALKQVAEDDANRSDTERSLVLPEDGLHGPKS